MHVCEGGSIPVFDEVILSTSLMNKVISLDQAAGTNIGIILSSIRCSTTGDTPQPI